MNFVVFPKTVSPKAFNYPAGLICVSRKLIIKFMGLEVAGSRFFSSKENGYSL